MTTSEWAAVAVAVVAALGVVALCAALLSLMRTLRALQAVVDTLRQETLPVVSDMRSTVRQANAELARVDGLIDSAQSVGATVDSASRLAYLAFSNPLVKAMALGAGTSRAYRRMRRRSQAG